MFTLTAIYCQMWSKFSGWPIEDPATPNPLQNHNLGVVPRFLAPSILSLDFAQAVVPVPLSGAK
jgi:hypothetical protein